MFLQMPDVDHIFFTAPEEADVGMDCIAEHALGLVFGLFCALEFFVVFGELHPLHRIGFAKKLYTFKT